VIALSFLTKSVACVMETAIVLTLLEHPLSSYAQKVKIALRDKRVAFTAEIPADLVSGTAAGALRIAARTASHGWIAFAPTVPALHFQRLPPR